MRLILLALWCISYGRSLAQADTSFPHKDISNGLIHARFYLPDTARGYYRGTRFDWSGVMPALEFKKHTYAGQWFEQYAPTIHDAIMGPVESFTPVGYERAVPGGHFVMVGVGALYRTSGAAYSPFRYYNIADPGVWRVTARRNRLEMEQTLKDTACSYVYHKTLELVKGKPVLKISHRLRNTGKTLIETNVYDHNFFILDRQPVGPGLQFSVPFGLEATEQRRIGDIAAIEGRKITLLRKPQYKEDVYAVLQGYGSNAKDYDIKMENRNTGAGIRITGDRPLSKLAFWGCPTVACPEPFIEVSVRPGQIYTWTIEYTFYEL
jgi:hypothetical protein